MRTLFWIRAGGVKEDQLSRAIIITINEVRKATITILKTIQQTHLLRLVVAWDSLS